MRRFTILAVAALGLGAAVLAYRGPGRELVRGHFGDVAATMLVYALLGGAGHALARWPLRSVASRLLATLAIAAGIEAGQLVWSGAGLLGELVLGSSFDGWDFVAYGLGAALAALYDRATATRPHADRVAGAERLGVVGAVGQTIE
jgi:Protein of unknown function (DUF2809)